MQEVLFPHDDFFYKINMRHKEISAKLKTNCVNKVSRTKHNNDKLSNNDTVFMRQNNTL